MNDAAIATSDSKAIAISVRPLLFVMLLICSPSCSAQETEYRYWTASDGKKSNVRLKVVNLNKATVKLQREDNGKTIAFPIAQLAQSDRDFLARAAAAKPIDRTQPTSSASNWNRFRGPNGNGVTDDATQLPMTWSDDENVRWKTTLPGAGASSPVVWENHIYLTCFTGTHGDLDQSRASQPLKLMLVCADLDTGNLLWQRSISDVVPFPEEHNREGNGALRDHGHASSTPVATADGVYAFFGASGLFRFDHDGNEQWRASCGTGWNEWGYAASPVVHDELVIINAALECKHILAFNKNTGEEVWRRDWISHSWGVPVVVKINGRNVFLDGEHGQLLALDADTGERMWTAEGFDAGSVTLVEGDVAFQQKLAVRFTESGAERLWSTNGSRVTGPALVNNRLYFCSDNKFQCLDAETGEFVYRERTPNYASSYASTLINGDRVYYVTRKHGTFVVRASDEFELLAHNQFEADASKFNASPAVAGDRLILRSDTTLYCIADQQ